jgi:hypothetical protein
MAAVATAKANTFINDLPVEIFLLERRDKPFLGIKFHDLTTISCRPAGDTFDPWPSAVR